MSKNSRQLPKIRIAILAIMQSNDNKQAIVKSNMGQSESIFQIFNILNK